MAVFHGNGPRISGVSADLRRFYRHNLFGAWPGSEGGWQSRDGVGRGGVAGLMRGVTRGGGSASRWGPPASVGGSGLVGRGEVPESDSVRRRGPTVGDRRGPRTATGGPPHDERPCRATPSTPVIGMWKINCC